MTSVQTICRALFRLYTMSIRTLQNEDTRFNSSSGNCHNLPNTYVPQPPEQFGDALLCYENSFVGG
jgi:hypothetical protein